MRQIIWKGGWNAFSSFANGPAFCKGKIPLDELPSRDTLGIFSWCFMRKWVDLLEAAFSGYLCLPFFACWLAGLLSQLKNTIHSPWLKPVSTDLHCVSQQPTKNRPFTCPKPSFTSHNFVSKLSLVWLSWFCLAFCQLPRTKAWLQPSSLSPLSHPPQSQSFW